MDNFIAKGIILVYVGGLLTFGSLSEGPHNDDYSVLGSILEFSPLVESVPLSPRP